jgi:hypothetical protein
MNVDLGLKPKVTFERSLHNTSANIQDHADLPREDVETKVKKLRLCMLYFPRPFKWRN